jgi:hypothetical protein
MTLQTLYDGYLAGKDKFLQVNPAPLNTLKYLNTHDKNLHRLWYNIQTKLI